MPRKHNVEAYAAELEIWAQAIESPVGITFRPKDSSADFQSWAINWQHRMNRARAADRERSKTIYDLGHPKHGKSDFDTYKVSIDKQYLCIRIEPRTEEIESIIIEEIPDGET